MIRKLLVFLFVMPTLCFAGSTQRMERLKDQCITVEEEDGSPANTTCKPVRVTNGKLTDNGSYYSLSISSSGLASTDIDTSSELDTLVTDDTGSGALVFATSPALVTPSLGVATATSLTTTASTGIGTATPNVLQGNTLTGINLNIFNASAAARIIVSGNADGTILFEDQGASSDEHIKIISSDGGDLFFGNVPDSLSGSIKLFTMRHSGSTGIGTATPDTLQSATMTGRNFQVYGSNSARAVVSGSGDATILLDDRASASDNHVWLISADNGSLVFGILNDALNSLTTMLTITATLTTLSGETKVSGVSGDGTGKAVCVKSDGNLGTCSDAVGASGTCTCG